VAKAREILCVKCRIHFGEVKDDTTGPTVMLIVVVVVVSGPLMSDVLSAMMIPPQNLEFWRDPHQTILNFRIF
jgi:hypothetical protein